MLRLKQLIFGATITVAILLSMAGAAKAEQLWTDWPSNISTSPGVYVKANNLMAGYPDGTFRPYATVTERQVVTIVADRGQLRQDLSAEDFGNYPATMEWVQTNFLPGTVKTAKLDEVVTRLRLAIMLERNNGAPSPITEVVSHQQTVADKINQWFSDTRVNGRLSRLVGTGDLFVQLARSTATPLWLALGQCYRESQWFTTGLSRTYNCGWGIKDSAGKYGLIRQVVCGYADYISVEEAIRAYFRVMSNSTYKPLIETGQWRRILNIYAPAYENNTRQHYATVMYIRAQCEARGIK
jgi:hypothetical protein